MSVRRKQIKDFQTIDMGQYRETGTMNEEAYVDTASGEMKEKLEKYEGQERGELEEKVLETENSIKSISNERYQELHRHPDYVEITINRETLIDQSRIAREKNPEVEAKGMFASRVPGTWGEKERTLVLPTDQVFQTDGGKTYLAFLAKMRNRSFWMPMENLFLRIIGQRVLICMLRTMRKWIACLKRKNCCRQKMCRKKHSKKWQDKSRRNFQPCHERGCNVW